jgi:protein TonB
MTMPTRTPGLRGGEAESPALVEAAGQLRLWHLAALAISLSVALAVGAYWFAPRTPGAPSRASSGVTYVRLVAPEAPRAAALRPAAAGPTDRHEPDVQPEAPRLVERSEVSAPDARGRAAMLVAAARPPTPAQLDIGAGGATPDLQRLLEAHIARHLRYPEAARRDRLSGLVELAFGMSRGGAVLEMTITKSSGHAALDREAVEAVQRAQPLPAIPPALPSRLTVILPVSFTAP